MKPSSPARRLNFDEDIPVSIGPLSVGYSLITSTWMTLDLQAHQEVLKVMQITCKSEILFNFACQDL